MKWAERDIERLREMWPTPVAAQVIALRLGRTESSVRTMASIMKLGPRRPEKPKPTSGIVCPDCGSKKSGVVDSRPAHGMHMRRRKCEDCDARWKTFEAHEKLFTDTDDSERAAEIIAVLELQIQQLKALLLRRDDSEIERGNAA